VRYNRRLDDDHGPGRLFLLAGAASGEGEPGAMDLRLLGTATFLRTTYLVADGHFEDHAAASFGIDGELVKARHLLRYGAAARYELGVGSERSGGGLRTEHYLSVTGLIGLGVPFGEDQAIELVFGLGPAVGLSGGGETRDHSKYMRIFGLGPEVMLTYLFSLRGGLSLAVGAGARFMLINVTNGGGYFDGAAGWHAVIRFGSGCAGASGGRRRQRSSSGACMSRAVARTRLT
jgi:hypothetical protein